MASRSPMFLTNTHAQTHITCKEKQVLHSHLLRAIEQAGGIVHTLPPTPHASMLSISRHATCHGQKMLALDAGCDNPVSPYIESFLQSQGFSMERSKQPATSSSYNLLPTPVRIVDNTAYVCQLPGCRQRLSEKVAKAFDIRCVDLVLKSNTPPSQSYFMPLSDGHALCYLDGFDAESQRKIQSEFQLLVVDHEEALLGACSGVLTGRYVILPESCHRTQLELAQLGYEPVPLPVVHHLTQQGVSLQDMVLAI